MSYPFNIEYLHGIRVESRQFITLAQREALIRDKCESLSAIGLNSGEVKAELCAYRGVVLRSRREVARRYI